MRHEAVLFDLFGTLIEIDLGRLPTVDVGGRSIRSTFPRWASCVSGSPRFRSALPPSPTTTLMAPAGEPAVYRGTRSVSSRTQLCTSTKSGALPPAEVWPATRAIRKRCPSGETS